MAGRGEGQVPEHPGRPTGGTSPPGRGGPARPASTRPSRRPEAIERHLAELRAPGTEPGVDGPGHHRPARPVRVPGRRRGASTATRPPTCARPRLPAAAAQGPRRGPGPGPARLGRAGPSRSTSGTGPCSSCSTAPGPGSPRWSGSRSATSRATTACSGCSARGPRSGWCPWAGRPAGPRPLAVAGGPAPSRPRPLAAPGRRRGGVPQHPGRPAQPPGGVGRAWPTCRAGRARATWSAPTSSATRAPATCWPTGPTSGWSRSCSATSPSPPPRSTPSSARTTCAASYERAHPRAGRSPAQVGSATVPSDAPTDRLPPAARDERAPAADPSCRVGFGETGGLDYDPNFADSSQVTAERGEAEVLAGQLQRDPGRGGPGPRPARGRQLRPMRGRAARPSSRRGSRPCRPPGSASITPAGPERPGR